MSTNINQVSQLLYLLQLASPSLPVGAYSYSEGLETLVDNGVIQSAEQLQVWIEQELRYGMIRVEAAVIVGVCRGSEEAGNGEWGVGEKWTGIDRDQLCYWNTWLSAWRDTSELRQQSWQMGRALLRLLQDLGVVAPDLNECFAEQSCNFAISFALAITHWQLDLEASILGFLQSWSANLVNAGIKLIPLGQTAGQRLMLNLHPTLLATTTNVLHSSIEQLSACSWGLSLASMQHETQYSRLFRS
jgi:urease accessory protein